MICYYQMNSLKIMNFLCYNPSWRRWLPALALAALQTPFEVKLRAQSTAVSANSFLNSIGVCTHITQGVDNPNNVGTCLNYTGIRNIRDDGSTNAATIKNWLIVHTLSGAKLSLLPINGSITNSLYEYEQVAVSNALLDVEGSNEPNNWPVTYLGQKSSNTSTCCMMIPIKDIGDSFMPTIQQSSLPLIFTI